MTGTPARPVRALRSVPGGLPTESFASHAELMAAGWDRMPYVQEALAVDFDVDEGDDDPLRLAEPTDRADLPDPRVAAAHLAQAVVEIVSGVRSPVQLLRRTSPDVYAALTRRAMLAQRRAADSVGPSRRRRPAVVRRVVVCEPRDGVAEATAVVVDGGRIRALAMRLAGYDGEWRLVVLELG